MTKIDLSNTKTNTRKFAAALVAGKRISAAQARHQYRLPNPSATVSNLREMGMRIVSTAGRYAAA